MGAQPFSRTQLRIIEQIAAASARRAAKISAPVPLMRPGTMSTYDPATRSGTVKVDGDLSAIPCQVVGAFEPQGAEAERVLVMFMPPHGCFVVGTLAEQRAIYSCTSSTRPSDPEPGLMIFESDTGIYRRSSDVDQEFLWTGGEPIYTFGSRDNQTISDNAVTGISCNVEDDPYGLHSISSDRHRFGPNLSSGNKELFRGLWIITVWVHYAGASFNRLLAGARIQSTGYVEWNDGGVNTTTKPGYSSLTRISQLGSGQWFEALTYQDAGANRTIDDSAVKCVLLSGTDAG